MSTKRRAKKATLDTALALELTDRELHWIGHIVAHWGALEHEIFMQTLWTYQHEPAALPKQMNNLNFAEVLDLWKIRVVNLSSKKRKAVLEKQLERIGELADFRNALVHGMWEWDVTPEDRITTTRIRRKQIIKIHFTAESLEDFGMKVATINFRVRYPAGMGDYAREMMREGGYMSRAFINSIRSRPS